MAEHGWRPPPSLCCQHLCPHSPAAAALLQVDAFLLPPAGAGLDETRRRAALLARRTEWLALGIPESEFPPAMREDELL
jgi:hypothetical protein